MRRALRFVLALTGLVSLAACGPTVVVPAPQDPCQPTYYDQALCVGAIAANGFYWNGVFHSMVYGHPFGYYSSGYNTYLVAHPGFVPTHTTVYYSRTTVTRRQASAASATSARTSNTPSASNASATTANRPAAPTSNYTPSSLQSGATRPNTGYVPSSVQRQQQLQAQQQATAARTVPPSSGYTPPSVARQQQMRAPTPAPRTYTPPRPSYSAPRSSYTPSSRRRP